MKEVTIKDSELRQAAAGGMDIFLSTIIDATYNAIGGTLTAETMGSLNSDQITLLAWRILHDEVMDGGFIQLIYNGYGPFVFKNPLAKALRQWEMRDLSNLIYDGHRLWLKYREELERDYSDDEFMSLFERFPEFDDLDDSFVEHEEEWTAQIARYVDEHIERFVRIEE